MIVGKNRPPRKVRQVADRMVRDGRILPEHRDQFARDLERAASQYARRFADRLGRMGVREAVARRGGSYN